MGTHVYANTHSIACKADDGKSIAAFPDVCVSPPAPPAGPLPLPYPNTSEAKDADQGTAKVHINDKPVCMGDASLFSKSMGDESATQNFSKGLISADLTGPSQFIQGSMDVQIEGKSAVRHGDPMGHNGKKPGNAAVAPFVSQSSPPPSLKMFDSQRPWISLRLIKATWYGTDRIRVRRNAVARADVHWESGLSSLESSPAGIPEARAYTSGFIQHPAVFCRDSAQSAPVFTLTVDVVAHKVAKGTTFELTTEIEGCELSGSYTYDGNGDGKEVQIFLRSPNVGKQFFRCATRTAQWKLQPPSDNITTAITGTTAHEMYFVFQNTYCMLYTNATGIHIEAVRVAWLACTHEKYGVKDHTQITEEQEVVRAVTQYLFHAYGLTYDTIEGRTVYLGGKGFNLLQYLTKNSGYTNLKQPDANNIVNCVTQGCAVRGICDAVGIHVATVIQKPFGFLKVIDLVGPMNAQCNNPFYKSTGYWINNKLNMKLATNVFIDQRSREEVEIKDVYGNPMKFINYNTYSTGYRGTMTPTDDAANNVYAIKLGSSNKENKEYNAHKNAINWNLTSFSMHFFNSHDGKIYDACGGPALGTNDYSGYMKTVVNHTINTLAEVTYPPSEVPIDIAVGD